MNLHHFVLFFALLKVKDWKAFTATCQPLLIAVVSAAVVYWFQSFYLTLLWLGWKHCHVSHGFKEHLFFTDLITAFWLRLGWQPAPLLPPSPPLCTQPSNPLQGALGGREPSPWWSEHRSPTHRSIVTGVRWGEREQNVTATGFFVFLFLHQFSAGLCSDPCAQFHWRDCWRDCWS